MASIVADQRTEELFDLGGDRFFVVIQHKATVDIHVRQYRRAAKWQLAAVSAENQA